MGEIDLKVTIDNMFNLYKKALCIYLPTDYYNGISEANLTHYFVQAFLNSYDDSFAFYEAPLMNENGSKKSRRDNHIDALIINQSLNALVLVESKRISGIGDFKSLGKDCRRMCDAKNIEYLKGIGAKAIENRYNVGFLKSKSKSLRIFAIVLVEVYNGQWAGWFNREPDPFSAAMKRKVQDVMEESILQRFSMRGAFYEKEWLWENRHPKQYNKREKRQKIAGLAFAYTELPK